MKSKEEKMKNKRQEKILQIIEENDITTQGMLQQKLEECGFEVTQTTISRDIRQLRLIKGQTDRGTYKYIMPARAKQNASGFNDAIVQSIHSVEAAGNLIILRTESGMADAVAVCLDSVKDERILGCIAGDDTIFLAVRTEEGAMEVRRSLEVAFGL